MMRMFLFVNHLVTGDLGMAQMWVMAVGVMALMVVLASLIDLRFGIKASKAVGAYKTTSYGFRATVEKDVFYLAFYFMAVMIDACLSFFLSIPVASVLCALAEIGIEAVSVYENNNRCKEGRTNPVNVAKAIAKSYGIKDMHKIELLVKAIKEESEKAHSIPPGTPVEIDNFDEEQHMED